MNIEEELQLILKRFKFNKETYNTIRTELEDIEHKLLGLQSKLELSMLNFSEFYKNHYDFLYNDVKSFMKKISSNTKEVIKLKFAIDELNFLYNDMNAMKAQNKSHIDDLSKAVN